MYLPFLSVVKNSKNGKPHVLTLQDMEQDSLQFDLAADTLVDQYEWYQVAWDITQREMSKQYSREQEVRISWCVMVCLVKTMSGHLNHLDCILTNNNRGYKRQCVNRKWLSVCPISDQTTGGSGEEG